MYPQEKLSVCCYVDYADSITVSHETNEMKRNSHSPISFEIGLEVCFILRLVFCLHITVGNMYKKN